MIEITLKLYASLAPFLPPESVKNTAPIKLEAGTTVLDVLEAYKLPLKSCHLVLVNGVFAAPAQRASLVLNDGDSLAVWPPVAGG